MLNTWLISEKTHDPFLKRYNKNNVQFNKMAMTNAEDTVLLPLLPSTSMTNQVIRLLLNLPYKVLQQWVMPETGDWICPSNVLTDTTSSSNQASLSVLCSLALKSLFLTSRHLPALCEQSRSVLNTHPLEERKAGSFCGGFSCNLPIISPKQQLSHSQASWVLLGPDTPWPSV